MFNCLRVYKLFVTSALLSMVNGRCPNDQWIDIFDSSSYCYHFSTNSSNYADTLSFCESMGGTMVTKIDEEIKDALKEIAQQRNIEEIWLGTTVNSENELVWLDGSPITLEVLGANGCLMVETTYGFLFKEWCYHAYHAVCQIEKIVGPCPNDQWIDISNSSSYCYHFQTDYVNYEDAVSYCESMDGTIVTKIDSLETNTALRKTAKDRGLDYFRFGTSLVPTYPSWSDGTPITYSNWASGQPGSEDCVKLDISSGQWFTTACSEDLFLGCQDKKEVNSDTGNLECRRWSNWEDLFPSSDYCYQLDKTEGDKTEIESYCDAGYIGTILSNIDSEGLNSAIVTEAISAGIRSAIYLGTKRGSELAWLDGSPFTYTNWLFDDINNDQCVSMAVSHGVWIQYNCNIASDIVCQIEKFTE